MRKLIIALVFGTAILAFAKDKETIAELQTRAAAAEKNKQPELYAELARRQVDAADEMYNDKPEQARLVLEMGIQSAEIAAKASLETGKHLKKTEINLRELSHRLEEVKASWAFEDRDPVKAAIQRVETARSSLLDRMFTK